jgi:hypothetical protein
VFIFGLTPLVHTVTGQVAVAKTLRSSTPFVEVGRVTVSTVLIYSIDVRSVRVTVVLRVTRTMDIVVIGDPVTVVTKVWSTPLEGTGVGGMPPLPDIFPSL